MATWFGIIQGSILGPILYAIFISPLFDIEKMTCYADDGFGLVYNKDKEVVAVLIKTKLTNTIDWLTSSGMKVNESKTNLCLFYHKDTTPIEIVLNGTIIKSCKTVNVLGVVFDQKMQWAEQVSHCVTKAKRALTAIRMIRKFFTTKELLQLVTSNVYSILFYNSEIWHLPSLKTNLKQKLLSCSAHAIKICVKYCTRDVSFLDLHTTFKRANPERFLLYKTALNLFKLMNSTSNTIEWVALNFNQILTSRQSNFITVKANRKKVGLNAFANRTFILNNKIPLKWFNMTLETFKIHCKKEFLCL